MIDCSYCEAKGFKDKEEYRKHLNQNHYKCWYCKRVVSWDEATGCGCVHCHDEAKAVLEGFKPVESPKKIRGIRGA